MKKVTGLFPTPVFSNTLDRELTENELAFIKENENKIRPNTGNYSSIDNQILESRELASIKKFFMDNIQSYFDDIICPRDAVSPYISLSWLNYTYDQGFHHSHCHNNSIISGVFYIQTNEDDKIHFSKLTASPIQFTSKNYHEFNSQVWWLPAEKNCLLLFPSDLYHEVKNHDSDETRISLSFNVFVKGKIGSLEDLSYIELK